MLRNKCLTSVTQNIEHYKFSTWLKQFAQRSKLFLNATKLAFQDLQNLKAKNEAYKRSFFSA
jgi:hypothetical protein